MKARLGNCKRILAFMKKEIKEIKRGREENVWRIVEQS